jgi:hypothetical protein
MIKSLEAAVSAVMQLTVTCTLGLSIAIGVAGVTKSKMPFACSDCAAVAAGVLVKSTAG